MLAPLHKRVLKLNYLTWYTINKKSSGNETQNPLYHPDFTGSTMFFILLMVNQGAYIFKKLTGRADLL